MAVTKITPITKVDWYFLLVPHRLANGEAGLGSDWLNDGDARFRIGLLCQCGWVSSRRAAAGWRRLESNFPEWRISSAPGRAAYACARCANAGPIGARRA